MTTLGCSPWTSSPDPPSFPPQFFSTLVSCTLGALLVCAFSRRLLLLVSLASPSHESSSSPSLALLCTRVLFVCPLSFLYSQGPSSQSQSFLFLLHTQVLYSSLSGSSGRHHPPGHPTHRAATIKINALPASGPHSTLYNRGWHTLIGNDFPQTFAYVPFVMGSPHLSLPTNGCLRIPPHTLTILSMNYIHCLLSTTFYKTTYSDRSLIHSNLIYSNHTDHVPLTTVKLWTPLPPSTLHAKHQYDQSLKPSWDSKPD